MTANPLLGVWQLKSWLLRDKQGNQHFPMGEDAQGYIIYTDTNIMSVHLSKAKRTLFQTPSIFHPSPEEASSSYQEYISYAGAYEIIAENTVLHKITMGTYPNWVGGVQERTFKVMGNELHITNLLEEWETALVWVKQRAIHETQT
jgi:hypothetical protein